MEGNRGLGHRDIAGRRYKTNRIILKIYFSRRRRCGLIVAALSGQEFLREYALTVT